MTPMRIDGASKGSDEDVYIYRYGLRFRLWASGILLTTQEGTIKRTENG